MKIGFIGCGNMGNAMMQGILKAGKCKPEEIMVSARTEQTLATRAELGVQTTKQNKEVAEFAELLFLAVKPQFYEEIIQEIQETVTEQKLIVSLAPGKTLEWFKQRFKKEQKIARLMPNTPAMVGEGMTAICVNENVTEEETNLLCELCAGFGKTELVAEHLMDVVTSVSGSSPAYVFLFIEAMADAAVADGMPRAQAYKFASQAVLGSAKMVLDTGMHPAVLKDMVCSPGGTTIQAVRVLEKKGMRSAVMEAMKACTEKSKGM